MTINNLVLSFLTAFALGVPAGFSPGPLIALAVKETARGGHRAGLRVAFIPTLLGNLPLGILCTIFFMKLHQWATSPSVQGLIIAITTGVSCVVLWRLAYKELRRHHPTATASGRSDDLTRPSFVDLLLVGAVNPNMMIFWGTAGGQLASQAYLHGLAVLFAFLLGFYVPMVASELTAVYGAALVRRGQSRLPAFRFHWTPFSWKYPFIRAGEFLVTFAHRAKLRLEKSPTWVWLHCHFHLEAPKAVMNALAYFSMGVWIIAHSYA